MAFTTIKTNQKTFLETYLRGTGKTLTAKDAKARFGIQQLPARTVSYTHLTLPTKRIV